MQKTVDETSILINSSSAPHNFANLADVTGPSFTTCRNRFKSTATRAATAIIGWQDSQLDSKGREEDEESSTENAISTATFSGCSSWLVSFLLSRRHSFLVSLSFSTLRLAARECSFAMMPMGSSFVILSTEVIVPVKLTSLWKRKRSLLYEWYQSRLLFYDIDKQRLCRI